jgi:hypothetical protein
MQGILLPVDWHVEGRYCIIALPDSIVLKQLIVIKKLIPTRNNTPSSFIGFYNPLASFSLLILEISRSHTMTQYNR